MSWTDTDPAAAADWADALMRARTRAEARELSETGVRVVRVAALPRPKVRHPRRVRSADWYARRDYFLAGLVLGAWFVAAAVVALWLWLVV